MSVLKSSGAGGELDCWRERSGSTFGVMAYSIGVNPKSSRRFISRPKRFGSGFQSGRSRTAGVIEGTDGGLTYTGPLGGSTCAASPANAPGTAAASTKPPSRIVLVDLVIVPFPLWLGALRRHQATVRIVQERVRRRGKILVVRTRGYGQGAVVERSQERLADLEVVDLRSVELHAVPFLAEAALREYLGLPGFSGAKR